MTLFLIDGHALAYRSYYAFIRNPLTNSKGENTSAVFGFLRVLLLLLRKFDPEYLAVVFDSGEETERHREFSEYKANREEMPDEMESQFPWIIEAVEALGIAVIEQPGYEADDVIATLAREAERDGNEVRIITADKDLFQLLSSKVKIIRPGKGTSLEDEIGPEYVKKRFGLSPSQVADLLALMGDSSDNIPGVKGIGEKTALKLLHEFGSLSEIMERVDEIEPSHVREKIESGVDDASLSKELVTLMDVPLDLALADLAPGERRDDELADLLIELEFHQILKELSLDMSGPGTEVSYVTVDGDSLTEMIDTLSRSSGFVLDTETTSLDAIDASLVGISFSTGEGKAWYLPIAIDHGERSSGFLEELDGGRDCRGMKLDEVRSAIGDLLSDETIQKIGHNIKYDLLVLDSHSLPVKGPIFDTMIASYLLDPERRSHSLDNLALEFCRHRMIPYEDLFIEGDRERDITRVPLDKLAEYSCEDADYTMRLKTIFEKELTESRLMRLFEDIEMPLCRVLKSMELEGISIDVEKLDKLSGEAALEMGRLTSEIHALAGEQFNINSGKQLQRILFEKLGLQPIRRTKTGFSTDMEVLAELAPEHEIAHLVLEYRQLAKLASTYFKALPKLVNPRTGRIHTSFNQTVTATGRLSSSEPNLQNIPIRTELGRRVRSAFIPRKDWLLLDADYSQIELRIMAHLSGDDALRDAFHEGADIHSRTAARIYGVEEALVTKEMRSLAKTINFGVIYGMGARGLSRQLAIELDEAKRFIDEYFETYPGVKEYIERSKELARERGYAETLLGRRRMLPEIGSGDGRARSFSERIAINMPIQGTAADMIKVAMVDIYERIDAEGFESRMILQVHDELVFEVPSRELERVRSMVSECMESAVELDVPVRVDMGTGANWLEAH
jgi:DNA polymerase-1